MLNRKKVVIAEPREAFRKGLYAIFSEETNVEVVEVSTGEELTSVIKDHSLDLIVVHQSLITNAALFSRTNVVILARVPDFKILFLARSYRVALTVFALIVITNVRA